MTQYEYRIVPSPRRAKKAKGARTPQDRFARTLTEAINAEAAEGWEYLRADTLPVDEKAGMLSAAKEVYQTVLVFRRAVEAPATRVAEPRQEPRAATPREDAPRAAAPREEPAFSRTRAGHEAEKPSFRFGPADDD
jgi:hypothetical protein